MSSESAHPMLVHCYRISDWFKQLLTINSAGVGILFAFGAQGKLDSLSGICVLGSAVSFLTSIVLIIVAMRRLIDYEVSLARLVGDVQEVKHLLTLPRDIISFSVLEDKATNIEELLNQEAVPLRNVLNQLRRFEKAAFFAFGAGIVIMVLALFTLIR